MQIYNIIEKKCNNQQLSSQEILYAVNSFVSGEIDRSQMASLLAAITINGMTFQETYHLTKAIQNSGKTLVFPFEVVDKHSTGGVSDSTTILLVPILASLGIKVAKMSGKSLGHTGGTVDKMSIFEGYNHQLSDEEFKKIVASTGGSIIGQTDNIAVADKEIYALRSRTATVSSIPLIASSVMSKKLASGASIILLDVKYGNGAFMRTKKQAIKLAKYMVQLGKLDSKKVWAVISNMNMPLANGVGTAYEVYSALKALDGEPSNLQTLSKQLSAILLSMAKNIKIKDAEAKVKQLPNITIKEKLAEIVTAHGGNDEFVFNPERILEITKSTAVMSENSGYISNIDALKLANSVVKMKEKVDEKDKNYQGLLLNVNYGDYINAGEELLKIYSNIKPSKEFCAEILSAFEFSKAKPKPIKLIEKVIK